MIFSISDKIINTDEIVRGDRSRSADGSVFGITFHGRKHRDYQREICRRSHGKRNSITRLPPKTRQRFSHDPDYLWILYRCCPI